MAFFVGTNGYGTIYAMERRQSAMRLIPVARNGPLKSLPLVPNGLHLRIASPIEVYKVGDCVVCIDSPAGPKSNTLCGVWAKTHDEALTRFSSSVSVCLKQDIPVAQVEMARDAECPICHQDAKEVNGPFLALPCRGRHTLCRSCAQGWRATCWAKFADFSCPMCRETLDGETLDGSNF